GTLRPNRLDRGGERNGHAVPQPIKATPENLFFGMSRASQRPRNPLPVLRNKQDDDPLTGRARPQQTTPYYLAERCVFRSAKRQRCLPACALYAPVTYE